MSEMGLDGQAPTAGALPCRRPPLRAFCRGATRALGLTLAFASLCTYAGDDLLSLYQDARGNNPVLRQAIANYRAVQELRTQAFSGLLPHIDIQASRSRVHLDQATSFASVNTYFYDTQYSLNLTQPIFNYGAYQRLDVADAQIAQAAAQLSAAEQNLIFTLAQRYFAVLSAQADLNFARSELRAFERQLQQAQQRFEVGLIAHTAVEEAKARRDLAQARLIQAENEVADRIEALRQVVGRPPEAVADLARKPTLKKPQPTVQQLWLAAAMDHNWRLIAARKAAAAAMENIQVQRAGHFPTIGLTASLSHGESGGTFGGETNQQAIGIQGELPIFQGFAVVSQVDEAQARYTEARARLEEVRRGVRQNTANAYRAVLTSIRRVRAFKQAVISNRSALQATKAGYQAGTRTIVDVLDALSNLFGAIRDYHQAQYSYLVSLLSLKQAAGTLDPQDLRAINALLGAHRTRGERAIQPIAPG